MEPNDLITIVLIVSVLAWAFVSIAHTFLDYRAEVKNAELRAKAEIETTILLAEALKTIERVSANKPPNAK